MSSSLRFIPLTAIVDAAGAAIGAMLNAAALATAASVDLAEATANGVNRIRLRAAAALAANRNYTLPDVGADADVLLTEGAQTVAGVKTFTPGVTFGVGSNLTPEGAADGAGVTLREATGNGVNTLLLRAAAALAANRIYLFPDAGADADVLLTQGAQTVAGVKTFTPGITFGVGSNLTPEAVGAGGGISLREATANGVSRILLQAAAALAGDRIYTFQDIGVDSDVMLNAGAQNISGVKTLVSGGGFNLGSGAGTLGLTGGFFIARGVAATGGAQTVAHGLGRVPTFRDVVIDGDAAGTLITLVSADINDVTFTTSAAAGTVRVLAM